MAASTGATGTGTETETEQLMVTAAGTITKGTEAKAGAGRAHGMLVTGVLEPPDVMCFVCCITIAPLDAGLQPLATMQQHQL